MAIRVRKVADLVGNLVVTVGHRPGDAATVLTNLEPVEEPLPESAWQLDLIIGEGDGARRIRIDLPPLLSKSHDRERAIFLGSTESIIYFRNRLFLADRPTTERF